MLALWALYDKADKKLRKLIVYTLLLLTLMRKCFKEIKIIKSHALDYNKEEVENKYLSDVYDKFKEILKDNGDLLELEQLQKN